MKEKKIISLFILRDLVLKPSQICQFAINYIKRLVNFLGFLSCLTFWKTPLWPMSKWILTVAVGIISDPTVSQGSETVKC